jgi:hypothetical protein
MLFHKPAGPLRFSLKHAVKQPLFFHVAKLGYNSGSIFKEYFES